MNPSEISETYGSPDLALLPMAAGSVLPYIESLLPMKLDHTRLTSSIHCTPTDAVEISTDMGSRMTLGIHWGTFTTPAHASETLAELTAARDERQISGEWGQEGSICVANIGQWLDVTLS